MGDCNALLFVFLELSVLLCSTAVVLMLKYIPSIYIKYTTKYTGYRLKLSSTSNLFVVPSRKKYAMYISLTYSSAVTKTLELKPWLCGCARLCIYQHTVHYYSSIHCGLYVQFYIICCRCACHIIYSLRCIYCSIYHIYYIITL